MKLVSKKKFISFTWLWLVAGTDLLWENSIVDYLIAGGWYWFSMRKQYCWMVGWQAKRSLVHASPFRIQVSLECCLARDLWMAARLTDLAFRNLRNSNSSGVRILCSCAASKSFRISLTISNLSDKLPRFCLLQILRVLAVRNNLTCMRRMASCVLTGYAHLSSITSLKPGMLTQKDSNRNPL